MKLLVLDGNSIINRAFYGIKLLTTKDGRYTNAIYGFMNIFYKLCDELHPDSVAFAFDLKAPTFRHKMYDEYKAGRKPMPPELAEQMPVLKDLLRALGYKIVTKEGYEADDILGTLAFSCKEGDECYIATGDRDSLQLVGDNVKVLLASTKMGRPETNIYDVKRIKDDYGVTPHQLIDIKALMGDSSDNIPGVSGVGQKTAQSLISELGSIQNIYDNIDTIDIRETLRNKLKNDKDSAFMSYKLGEICKSVPIETDYSFYVPDEGDKGEALSILRSLEMYKLIDKIGLNTVTYDAKPENTTVKEYKRVKKGIFTSWLMCSGIILVGSVIMFLKAPSIIGIFTEDAAVISVGSSMIRIFGSAYLFLPIIQILNGALRGAGRSKVPMYFMLGCFVLLRQIYLMIAVPMTKNVSVVFAGWPVTWVVCAIGMLVYYFKVDWLPKEE